MPLNAKDMDTLALKGADHVEVGSKSELFDILFKYVDDGQGVLRNGTNRSTAAGLVSPEGLKRSFSNLRRVTDEESKIRKFNEVYVIENGEISRRLSRRELANARKACLLYTSDAADE